MGRETYLRSKEAAEYIGVCFRTMHEYIGVCFRTMQNYIADGLIPCTKPGGRWLFKKRDLDAFLNNENR